MNGAPRPGNASAWQISNTPAPGRGMPEAAEKAAITNTGNAAAPTGIIGMRQRENVWNPAPTNVRCLPALPLTLAALRTVPGNTAKPAASQVMTGMNLRRPAPRNVPRVINMTRATARAQAIITAILLPAVGSIKIAEDLILQETPQS